VTSWAWLLPTLPAVAAVVGLLLGRRFPGGPATPAVVGTLAALVVSIALVAAVEGDPAVAHESSTSWTPIGGLTLHVGTRIDGLAAVVSVMVCVVALLVQIYSIGYLAGDGRYSHPELAAEMAAVEGRHPRENEE
jgi:NADH-quinone oxidoreductase subunit L